MRTIALVLLTALVAGCGSTEPSATGGTVRGVVTFQIFGQTHGTVTRNAAASIGGQTAQVTAAGYTFAGVPAGTYTVTVSATGTSRVTVRPASREGGPG